MRNTTLLKKLIPALFLLLGLTGKAQPNVVPADSSLNELFLEAGGIAGHLSFNYARHVGKSKNLLWRFGAGVILGGNKAITIPAGVFYEKKFKNPHRMLEFGTGICLSGSPINNVVNSKSKITSYYPYLAPTIAFKSRSPSGLSWRLAFDPLIGNEGILPWAGLSLGRSF